jgi:hypothetical protein
VELGDTNFEHITIGANQRTMQIEERHRLLDHLQVAKMHSMHGRQDSFADLSEIARLNYYNAKQKQRRRKKSISNMNELFNSPSASPIAPTPASRGKVAIDNETTVSVHVSEEAATVGDVDHELEGRSVYTAADST